MALLVVASGRLPIGAAQQTLRVLTARMVVIEAGRFLQGTSAVGLSFAVRLCRQNVQVPEACVPEAFEDEMPQRRVYLSRYGIDRWEVSIADYQRCVNAGICAPTSMSYPKQRRVHAADPVVGVTWADARRYCHAAGGRLPTEAEWERAARGVDGRQFPWGSLYNEHLANHGQRAAPADMLEALRHVVPVQSFHAGRSPDGLLHMAGNVWELTADHYAEGTYSGRGAVDPTGPQHGSLRVIRGGSWRSAPYQLRAAHRATLLETAVRADVGFRCAYDVR